MKKLAILMVIALLAMSVVSATDGTLSEETITMGYNDVRVVEYCLEHNDAPIVGMDLVIDYVWQEYDNVIGYSAGDTENPVGFTAVLLDAQTDANGCGDIELTTSDEAGTFGYSVNGDNGQTLVGNEIGTVLVPEFGIIAAFGVLATAGLFIYKKRN